MRNYVIGAAIGLPVGFLLGAYVGDLVLGVTMAAVAGVGVALLWRAKGRNR